MTAAQNWPQQVPDHVRHDALNRAVLHEIGLGARIQSQSEFFVVLVKGVRQNHVLHLLLTVFTAGLWLPIWILVAVTRQQQRIVLAVDEFGVVRQVTGVPAARP